MEESHLCPFVCGDKECSEAWQDTQGAAGEGQGGGTGQQKWLWWPEDTVTEAAKEPQPFPSS